MTDISMDELRAIEKMLNGFDLIVVDGQPWFMARADNDMIDTLAAFGSEREDMEAEPDLEEEPDLEADHDNERDYVDAFPGDAAPIHAGGRNIRRPETPITAPKAIIEIAQPK